VLSEILKHPIARLEYVELDPYLIRLLERYGGSQVSEELHDPWRAHHANRCQVFMKQEGRLYDIVLIGAAAQQTSRGTGFLPVNFFLW
jgi:spermidine synthase